jgi:hypothetical protein
LAKVSGPPADVVDVEMDAELAEIAGLLEFLADERRREDDEPLAVVLPFRRASDRDVRRRSGGAAG